MNISNKMQRRLIIAVTSLFFFVINIVWAFMPLYKDVGEQKNTIVANKEKIESLKDIEAQKEELKKKDKFFKSQFLAFSQKLPNYLTPEQFVTTLKGIIDENGLIASDISFTKPEAYSDVNLKPDYPLGGSLEKQANDIIEELYANDVDKENKATSDEIQLEGISEESAAKVILNFSFSGSYYNVKSFIKSVENYFSNAVINSINMNPAGDKGIISGTMQISLYGFKDSKIPVYNLWTKELQKGKNDLFGVGGSVRYNIDDTSVSDFDISLNPYTSDSPTLVMKKHGEFATGIFGDNKGNEDTLVEITERNGTLSYRYKTSSMSYPQNYAFTTFRAVNSKDIVVKVYSKPRVGEADNAGMNLTIKKPSGMNVRVIVYNDDEVKPRVNYTIK